MVRTRSGGEVVVRRAGGGARKRAALAEIEENVPKRTRGKKGESIPTTDDVVARDGGKSVQDGGEGSGKRGGDVGVDNPRESAKNVAAKTEKNDVPSKKTKRKASQKRKKPKKTQQEEEEQNVDSAEPASAVLLHGTRRPSFGGSSDDSSQNKIVITYSKKTQRESRRPLTTHLRAIRRKSSIRKRRSSVGSGTVDGGDDELFEPESEEDGSPEGKESARMEKFLAQQRRIWDEIDNYELEET